LPSKLEGLPLALLEGMAFGLPALATPVGGIADFVETGENGLLVEPGDIDGLADSIRLLADDPGLRARLGEEARRRVRATTGDQELARRWREVYAACEERRR
jgi:glycosyltransferase involved in cell wall biosynthesis